MTNRATLIYAIIVMGLLSSLFGCSKNPDPDESVLIQLKKAGSDLSKPHQIEFFLYFPTQSVAEKAAPTIREGGFEVKVRPAAKGTDWLCLATKTMIPKLSDLQQISREFNRLTAAAGGAYDGWGTAVIK